MEIDGVQCIVFLDLIIRLTMCRAYAAQLTRKLITSERLLGLAHDMVLRIKDGSACLVGQADSDKHLRQEASVIPLDILEQKLYFKQGVLQIMMNRPDIAYEKLI